VDLLPKSLQEICYLIGFPSTLLLIELFGGRQLYIPKKLSDGHALWQIGEEAANLLSQFYGGQTLPLPLAKQLILRDRNQKIIEARRAGFTVQQISKRFSLTQRQIWVILSKFNAEKTIDQRASLRTEGSPR